MLSGAEFTASRAHVLHVSGDFPDPFEPAKTGVIRTLLGLTGEKFSHRVVSLNRASPDITDFVAGFFGSGASIVETEPFDHGDAWRYAAPPLGIQHKSRLEALGDRLASYAAALEARPSLIVGHKLTIEGVVVRKAAQTLGIPYALCIQGNTDTKIVRARPDLKGVFSEIYHGAKIVFPFAPWAQEEIESSLGTRTGPTQLLPCPTDLDRARKPLRGGNGLISVFHLKGYRGKNLAGMVAACKILEQQGRPTRLEIVGGGTRSEMETCRSIARDCPDIDFPGALGRGELSERMRGACALVLPSLRESFGLVFIEALFAGTPIIYPAGAAVDGYFDDLPFAMRVDARDPNSIASAMRHAIEQEDALKNSLEQWQQSDAARRFTRDSIAQVFSEGLQAAIRER